MLGRVCLCLAHGTPCPSCGRAAAVKGNDGDKASEARNHLLRPFKYQDYTLKHGRRHTHSFSNLLP